MIRATCEVRSTSWPRTRELCSTWSPSSLTCVSACSTAARPVRELSSLRPASSTTLSAAACARWNRWRSPSTLRSVSDTLCACVFVRWSCRVAPWRTSVDALSSAPEASFISRTAASSESRKVTSARASRPTSSSLETGRSAERSPPARRSAKDTIRFRRRERATKKTRKTASSRAPIEATVMNVCRAIAPATRSAPIAITRKPSARGPVSAPGIPSPPSLSEESTCRVNRRRIPPDRARLLASRVWLASSATVSCRPRCAQASGFPAGSVMPRYSMSLFEPSTSSRTRCAEGPSCSGDRQAEILVALQRLQQRSPAAIDLLLEPGRLALREHRRQRAGDQHARRDERARLGDEPGAEGPASGSAGRLPLGHGSATWYERRAIHSREGPGRGACDEL